jgi:hypothetical protein
MVLTGFIFFIWFVAGTQARRSVQGRQTQGLRAYGMGAHAMRSAPGVVLIRFLLAKIGVLRNCRFGNTTNGRKLSVKKRLLSLGKLNDQSI